MARRRALPVQDDAQGGRCIRSAAHAWFLVARRPVMTLFPSLSLFASSLIIDWEKKEKEEASVCWEKGSSSRILCCKSCQERDRRRRLRCATSAPHKPALRSPFQLCLHFPHSYSSDLTLASYRLLSLGGGLVRACISRHLEDTMGIPAQEALYPVTAGDGCASD